MSHQNHPANLSLLLSDLTEEDQGTYRCTVNNKQSISICLSIKVFSPSENVNTPFTGHTGGRKQNSQEKRGESKHNEVEETVVLYIQTASLTGSVRQQERSVSSPTQP
ncbi:uncharacterized protein LOC143486802 isoform X1 [Brachyhypopomus gauderio]|uniref:uncharacterized protein LOC143486802 isoform X1 n=1 Tax=Brachyhypopomus gauderio TaxID=698409 RepID=UPI004042BF11